MPLFTKEPVRLHNPGGNVASTSRLLFDDADESEWMFVATSRQVRSFTDRLQRKLRMFDSMTKYERRHVRVQVRNGSDLSLQLFRSDSIHDSDCVAYYDLAALQNVKNVFLDKEDALPYMTFMDENGGRDATVGVAVTELVYGQVGIRLELEESVSDGVDRRRSESGEPSTVGARMAAQFEVPLGAMADAVRGTLNDLDGGGTDGHNGATGGSGSRSAAGKVSKKLQKKLERKGKATSLHLVLPSVDARDAWGHWFKTLMRHLELQRISEMEVDPITGEHLELIDPDMIQRMADARSTTIASNAFRSAVKDLTNRFMNLNVRGGVDGVGTEAPNKGCVQVRAPGADAFVHVRLSAWMQTGEVVMAPYQPKESLSKSLLSLQQLFGRSGDNDGGDLPTVRSSSSGALGPVRKLRLSEQTLIRAPTPWSCEFQIIFSSSTAGGAAAGGGGVPGAAASPAVKAVSWYFIAPNTDARRAFVEWLRLVKGRGTKAQTELDTYPYQTASDGVDGDDGIDVADGDGGGDGRRWRVGLAEQIHASHSVSKAAAAAAAFVIRQQSGLVGASSTEAAAGEEADDGDVEGSASGTHDSEDADAPQPVHQRGVGEDRRDGPGTADQQSRAPTATAGASRLNVAKEALDMELRLFADLQEPPMSPRSDDSVHSVRRFTYFPRHAETATEAYLTDVCAVHLLGRNERAGGNNGQHEKKKPMHWAYAVQRAAKDGRMRGWDATQEVAGEAEGSLAASPRVGGRRSSILVDQLLLSPAARRLEHQGKTDKPAGVRRAGSPSPGGGPRAAPSSASASSAYHDRHQVPTVVAGKSLKDHHYLGRTTAAAASPSSPSAAGRPQTTGDARRQAAAARAATSESDHRVGRTASLLLRTRTPPPSSSAPSLQSTPSSVRSAGRQANAHSDRAPQRALLRPGAFSELRASRTRN